MINEKACFLCEKTYPQEKEIFVSLTTETNETPIICDTCWKNNADKNGNLPTSLIQKANQGGTLIPFIEEIKKHIKNNELDKAKTILIMNHKIIISNHEKKLYKTQVEKSDRNKLLKLCKDYAGKIQELEKQNEINQTH